jgi:hypothetical protein
MKDDARTKHVLMWALPVSNYRDKPRAFLAGDNHADVLSHAPAWHNGNLSVDLLIVSVH